MKASDPLLTALLLLASCCRRSPPAVGPEPPGAARTAEPTQTARSTSSATTSAREAVEPDAATSAARMDSNPCSQNEPDTDPRVALGLSPRAGRGADARAEFGRTDVFLRALQRPIAPGTSAGGLSLELRGPTAVARDAPIPLQLSFRNTSAQALSVIKSNDGSYEHMREPFVDLYVEDVASQQVFRGAFVGGRCGMVNPLTAADLVSIPPGTSTDAPAREWSRQLQRSQIPARGRYRLWAVYRLCELDRAQGMGQPMATRPANLWTGRVASNAIELTVR